MPAGRRRSCSSSPGAAPSPASAPTHSPLAGRDARFVVHPLCLWEDPADDERMHRARPRLSATTCARAPAGAAYLNFIGDEGEERVRAGFGPGNYERLARVKAAWDPENVFQASGNVPPVDGPAATAA